MIGRIGDPGGDFANVALRFRFEGGILAFGRYNGRGDNKIKII